MINDGDAVMLFGRSYVWRAGKNRSTGGQQWSLERDRLETPRLELLAALERNRARYTAQATPGADRPPVFADLLTPAGLATWARARTARLLATGAQAATAGPRTPAAAPTTTPAGQPGPGRPLTGQPGAQAAAGLP